MLARRDALVVPSLADADFTAPAFDKVAQAVMGLKPIKLGAGDIPLRLEAVDVVTLAWVVRAEHD